MKNFNINEKHLSQLPALQLLMNMGYEYISPSDTLKERQDRMNNVILENILRSQLKKMNRISYKGNEYLFSEENIQTAIQQLKNIKYDGLLKTNEKVYDLLTLGIALEQTIEGNTKSFTFNYIDWKQIHNNCFHVTIEYNIEKSRSTETARPDIVLFVNGIPFCIIECKSPKIDIKQAVSQSIRNQNDDHIPKLFTYSQLLLAINKNAALYATTGTSAKFWSIWKEPLMDVFEDFDESDLANALTSINNEIEKLDDRYADLWDIFKPVQYAYDEEAYERHLADDDLREDFYERLAAFSKNLAIALSSEQFLSEMDDKTIMRYKIS